MKNPLEYIGLGDGEGNVSSTRVMLVMLLAFWMAMKVFNALHPENQIVISGDDLAILGGIFGVKSIHAAQENSGRKQTTTPETAQPKKEQ